MGGPPIILSIDTATLGGSVCITRGKVLLTSSVGDPAISHSNSLLRDIKGCLDDAGVALAQVDLFAAASGPGSFTGLRIGLATVKGLAATLGRPCIGVPTLVAIAHAGGTSSGTVALLPAGRGEVFVQLFSVEDDGAVNPIDTAAHLTPRRMLERYGSFRSLTWSGQGAHIHRDVLREFALEKGIEFHEAGLQNQGWKLSPEDKNLSKHIATLAVRLLESDKLVDPESLHAIYVRPSDAELKW